jgi:hypothetical protein
MFQTKMRIQKALSVLMLVVLTALAPASVATAACPHFQESCKAGYGVSGATFNAGGQYACDSHNLCANQTAGENAVGETCKSGAGYFCTEAGFNTSNPYIELLVTDTAVDAGVLTSTSTHVGTARFSVKTYLAHGYAVTTSSPGPKSGSHILDLMNPVSGLTSTLGKEQFGMNLVANDCPPDAPGTGAGSCTGTFGHGPTQVPDNTFSFGDVASGYDTPNQYRYADEDTIANSSRSSGETDFTISYLFNISNVTPAGEYTMNQSLVATSTF